jgi:hypothetical protein
MLLCAMRRVFLAGTVIWWGVAAMAAAQDADRSVTGDVLKGEYSTARAMDLVYGGYDVETKSSIWSPKAGPNWGNGWPGVVRVQVLKDDTYSDGGVPRHVLATWARPDVMGAGEYSCHACGVLVGVVVFRKEAAGWKVESSDLQLAQIGVSGLPPKAKAQRLGAHTWGVVAWIGDMHQGQVEQAMWIFGPKTGGFGEWFKAELVDDDKYGEFPQDDWCKQRTGELDVMCIWREIDYSMHAEEAKQVYDMVRTRRMPNGVKLEIWRFEGERFAKATQQASVVKNP